MRIAVPRTGETFETQLEECEPFETQLEEDDFHMLGLNEPNRRSRRMGCYLLSAVLKLGWRIASVSPEEQAVLDAHGFGSGRVQ